MSAFKRGKSASASPGTRPLPNVVTASYTVTSAIVSSAPTKKSLPPSINCRSRLPRWHGRTVESLCTSENKAEDLLEDLKKDIDHQEIKISAKDGVIEGLMRSENRLTLDIENLLSQLNILKSLSDYSSVNVGVIARFKEFSKIEDELREKERIIERLNNVIDEYRTPEDFTRCSDITV